MGTIIGFDHKYVNRLPKTQGVPFVADGVARVDPVYAAGWDKHTWTLQRIQTAIGAGTTYDAIYIDNVDTARSLVIMDATLLCGNVPGGDLYATLSANVTAVDDGNFDPIVATPFGSGRNTDDAPDPLLLSATILEGNAATAAFTNGVGGRLTTGWPLPANTEASWKSWIIPPASSVGISIVNASGAPQNAILSLLVIEVS